MYVVLKTTSYLAVTVYGTMEGKPFRSEASANNSRRAMEKQEEARKGESTFLVLEVHATSPAMYAMAR